MSEPLRLTEYRSRKAPFLGRLFTCARPGRTLGAKTSPIDDATVKRWVEGLPRLRPLHIVSLLGKKPKPSDISEYSYYSFRGCHESPSDRLDSMTFQEWLNLNYGSDSFVIIDFPTIDTEPIESMYLTQICETIQSLLAASASVVVVDSGGVGRTGKVCASLHASPI